MVAPLRSTPAFGREEAPVALLFVAGSETLPFRVVVGLGVYGWFGACSCGRLNEHPAITIKNKTHQAPISSCVRARDRSKVNSVIEAHGGFSGSARGFPRIKSISLSERMGWWFDSTQ
jgi:hypothetical protein